MSDATVDLMSFLDGSGKDCPLERVRISGDETPLIPFTTSADRIMVHYCNEPEIRDYVACQGAANCPLCQGGKTPEDRLLLPVYRPIERRVGVLFLSTSMRPQALLPQLLHRTKEAEAANQRVLLFVKKGADFASFAVTHRSLNEKDDDGSQIVQQFLTDKAAGTVDLKSVVQHLSVDQLKAVGSIAAMLELKGGAL